MVEMNFKLLEIDLTHRKTNVLDMTEEMRRYLGGRGLGAKLLWDRVPKGADPLSPENILYFGVGPITGFMGSVVNVSAKSPLTLLRGQSNMNGHFGSELVYAGYGAGLLLTGKAANPVYICIKDDQVEIRDASRFWGKLNLETQQALRKEIRKELDDQNFRILSIGPAGEKLVRNASITHDFYHHAARLGMGAVMGSKNVKAIAIRGTRPPRYHDPARLWHLTTNYFNKGHLQKAQERRWGHMVSMSQRYYEGREGIKNKQLGWDPICDLSNPVRHEHSHKLWNDGCTLCHIGCKVPYMRRDPPLGPCVGEFRHDSAGGWNANVMIPGFEQQTYLTPFVDDLGLDNEDVSGIVAWIMECYQRGLLSQSDLDGIDLTWGNLKAICEMVSKIAHRRGVGDVLAEGLKFAPQKLGKDGLEKYAMTSKGVAITSYEPRGSLSDAIGLAVVPCGELHGGRGGLVSALFDSITACVFLTLSIPGGFGGFRQWGTEMLKAACGWDFSEQEWDDLLKRILFVERCYSLREGHVPSRDDTLPERFFTEAVYQKYGKKLILDRDEFHKQRANWYRSVGLSEEGLPSKADLSALGLGFAIPELEKTGVQLP